MELENTELTETGGAGKPHPVLADKEDGTKSAREEKPVRTEKQEKTEKMENPAEPEKPVGQVKQKKQEKPAEQEKPVKSEKRGKLEKQGKSVRKAPGRSSAGQSASGRREKDAAKSGTAGGSGRRAGSGPSGSGRHRKRGRSGTGVRKQPVTESFRHAFDGIFTGLGERNMKIHCTMAVLVVIFGVFLRISVTEWCLCLVLFGLIMGLELVNTAVEAVVDLVTEEYHPLAKKAKDTAAGAVLIAAIMAAIAGLIIFIPRLLYVFHRLL